MRLRTGKVVKMSEENEQTHDITITSQQTDNSITQTNPLNNINTTQNAGDITHTVPDANILTQLMQMMSGIKQDILVNNTKIEQKIDETNKDLKAIEENNLRMETKLDSFRQEMREEIQGKLVQIQENIMTEVRQEVNVIVEQQNKVIDECLKKQEKTDTYTIGLNLLSDYETLYTPTKILNSQSQLIDLQNTLQRNSIYKGYSSKEGYIIKTNIIYTSDLDILVHGKHG